MARDSEDDWRNWKDGKYDNKYSGNKSRNKNHNKSILVLTIVCVAGIASIVIGANDDITVNNQKIEEMIPTESIENTINDISNKIPVEEIENEINDISDSIPVKIEPKSENSP